MSEPVLEVEDLRVYYLTRTGSRIQAVDGVTFHLGSGEVLGVAGESGCGKSTLAHACVGLFLPPLHFGSGAIRIAGASILGLSVEQNRRDIRGRRIAVIPQGALSSLNPTRRIRDLAADMILSHDERAGRQEIDERLRERFERIGLKSEQVLGAYPIELPAGIKQRAVIGISTLLNPDLVIADEPTSALDVTTQKAVIRLLFDLMDQGIVKSMIFITHELPLLRHVSSSIAVMYAGQFVEWGKTEQVVFDGRQPYTQALMGSTLSAESGQRDRKPVALEGAPPDLVDPIEGCRFAERCPVAQPECGAEPPQLRRVAGRLVRCRLAS